MKFFVEPKLDAELFSVEDVITVSDPTPEEPALIGDCIS